MTANPCPPPTHNVARPRSSFRSQSARSKVRTSRVPDVPTGCPNAIAPPLTFSRCGCSGNKDYPEIADDFAKGFKILKSLPCDVFLGAHGAYYGMLAKYDRVKKEPKNNPFVDPTGYRDYIEEREKTFRAKLAEQSGELR